MDIVNKRIFQIMCVVLFGGMLSIGCISYEMEKIETQLSHIVDTIDSLPPGQRDIATEITIEELEGLLSNFDDSGVSYR